MISKASSKTIKNLAQILSSKFDISDDLLQSIVEKALSLSSNQTNDSLEKIVKEQFKDFKLFNIPNVVKNFISSKLKIDVTTPKVDKNILPNTNEDNTLETNTQENTETNQLLNKKIFVVLEKLSTSIDDLKKDRSKEIKNNIEPTERKRTGDIYNFLRSAKTVGKDIKSGISPILNPLMSFLKPQDEAVSRINNPNIQSKTNLLNTNPFKPDDEAVSRINTQEVTQIDTRQGSNLESVLKNLPVAIKDNFKEYFENLNSDIDAMRQSIQGIKSGGGGGGLGLTEMLMMRGMRGRGGRTTKSRRPGVRRRAARMKVGSAVRKSVKGAAALAGGAAAATGLSKLAGPSTAKVGTEALEAAGETAAKTGTKTASKTVAKAGVKSLLKKIPLVGLGLGGVFAAQRALAGDWSGAGLELASGAASTVPGIGTAASLGLDAALMAKDLNAPGDQSEIEDSSATSSDFGDYGDSLTPEDIQKGKDREAAMQADKEYQKKLYTPKDITPREFKKWEYSYLKEKAQELGIPLTDPLYKRVDKQLEEASGLNDSLPNITPVNENSTIDTTASGTENLSNDILEEIASNTEDTNKNITGLTQAVLKLAQSISKNNSNVKPPVIVNQPQQETMPSASQMSDANVDPIRHIRRQFLV